MHPVTADSAEYPHSTLNGTPTCSSYIGTALYETHVAGQEESGHVLGGDVTATHMRYLKYQMFVMTACVI